MTQYPPVGSQGVYNVILYAGGVDPAYTLHWFWFKNQTDAQGGLFVIDDQWDPMIVLNPGDIIAIGNTSGFPLTTSGHGHILPISQQS